MAIVASIGYIHWYNELFISYQFYQFNRNAKNNRGREGGGQRNERVKAHLLKQKLMTGLNGKLYISDCHSREYVYID